MTHNLQLRHQVIKAIRRYLEDEQGFIEVETPILTLHPRRRTGLPPHPRQSREWFAFTITATVQTTADGRGLTVTTKSLVASGMKTYERSTAGIHPAGHGNELHVPSNSPSERRFSLSCL